MINYTKIEYVLCNSVKTHKGNTICFYKDRMIIARSTSEVMSILKLLDV